MRAGGLLNKRNAASAPTSANARLRPAPPSSTKPTADTSATPLARPSRPSSRLIAFTSATTITAVTTTPANTGAGTNAPATSPIATSHDNRNQALISVASSATPSTSAIASGASHDGRVAPSTTATPANTATPPRYGIGRSCTFSAPGWSRTRKRTAALAARGVATRATRNATPAASAVSTPGPRTAHRRARRSWRAARIRTTRRNGARQYCPGRR